MSNRAKQNTGKNNRRLIIINSLTFTLVAVVLVWITVKYLHIGEKDFTNDAQVEAFINPINTRIPAYIKEIKFIEHQRVKAGDTLVILDDRELLTQVAQSEAAYLNAISSKGVSQSSIRTVDNNLTVASSNIAGAKAKLWNAEQNYNRYKSLLEDEAVTKQQFEQVKTEYDALKAQYEALLHQQRTTSLSVEESKSRLNVNDAEIKRTAAALEMAKINHSYTIIRAPYDGVMGRRAINVGQLLQAGQQIATIIPNTQKWITANFREKQMPSVKIGSEVQISVDALNGKKYIGKVTAISEATGAKYAAIPVDNSTGNFVKVQQRIPVRIEFAGSNTKDDLDLLRAGMNVEIRIK